MLYNGITGTYLARADLKGVSFVHCFISATLLSYPATLRLTMNRTFLRTTFFNSVGILDNCQRHDTQARWIPLLRTWPLRCLPFLLDQTFARLPRPCPLPLMARHQAVT